MFGGLVEGFVESLVGALSDVGECGVEEVVLRDVVILQKLAGVIMVMVGPGEKDEWRGVVERLAEIEEELQRILEGEEGDDGGGRRFKELVATVREFEGRILAKLDELFSTSNTCGRRLEFT